MPLWKKKAAPVEDGKQVSAEVKDWLERFESARSMNNYWNMEGLSDEIPRMTSVKPGELYQMHRMLADIFNGPGEMHNDKRAYSELIATADSVAVAGIDPQLAVHASFDAFKIFIEGRLGNLKSAEQVEIDGLQFITAYHLSSDSVSLLGYRLYQMHKKEGEGKAKTMNVELMKDSLKSFETAKKLIPRFRLDSSFTQEIDSLIASTQRGIGFAQYRDAEQKMLSGHALLIAPKAEEETFLGVTFNSYARSFVRARILFSDSIEGFEEARKNHAEPGEPFIAANLERAKIEMAHAEESRLTTREAEWKAIRPLLEKAIRDKKTNVKTIASSGTGKATDLGTELVVDQVGGFVGGYVAGKVAGEVTKRLVRRAIENIKIEELDTKGHEEFMNQDDIQYPT